jgi:hypothetical protein
VRIIQGAGEYEASRVTIKQLEHLLEQAQRLSAEASELAAFKLHREQEGAKQLQMRLEETRSHHSELKAWNEALEGQVAAEGDNAARAQAAVEKAGREVDKLQRAFEVKEDERRVRFFAHWLSTLCTRPNASSGMEREQAVVEGGSVVVSVASIPHLESLLTVCSN